MTSCVHSVFTDVEAAAYHTAKPCSHCLGLHRALKMVPSRTVPCMVPYLFIFFRIWLQERRWWNKQDSRVMLCPSRLDLGKRALALRLAPTSGRVGVFLHVCLWKANIQNKKRNTTPDTTKHTPGRLSREQRGGEST